MSLLQSSRLSHQWSQSWGIQPAQRCWSGGAEAWEWVQRSLCDPGTGRASSSTILSTSHCSGAPSL